MRFAAASCHDAPANAAEVLSACRCQAFRRHCLSESKVSGPLCNAVRDDGDKAKLRVLFHDARQGSRCQAGPLRGMQAFDMEGNAAANKLCPHETSTRPYPHRIGGKGLGELKFIDEMRPLPVARHKARAKRTPCQQKDKADWQNVGQGLVRCRSCRRPDCDGQRGRLHFVAQRDGSRGSPSAYAAPECRVTYPIVGGRARSPIGRLSPLRLDRPDVLPKPGQWQ